MVIHSKVARRRVPVLGAVILGATALVLSGCSAAAEPAATGDTGTESSSYSIGVFQAVQSDFLDQLSESFQTTVKEGAPDIDFTFDLKNANGDQSLISSIARDFASSDDDAFVVLGTPAVIALAQQATDKPIFAIGMGDPVGAGVAASIEEPGANVTGSIDYIDPAKTVDELLLIDPDMKSIGTVYDPSNQNMQLWADDLRSTLEDRGIDLVEATVSGTGDIATAARSVTDRSDVVLIGPDSIVTSGADAVGTITLALVSCAGSSL